VLLSLTHVSSPSFTFFFPFFNLLLLLFLAFYVSFFPTLFSFTHIPLYLLHIYFITFFLYLSIHQYPFFSSSSHISLLYMFLPLSHISFPSLIVLSSSLCLCVCVFVFINFLFMLCVSPHFQCFFLIPHQCDGCSSILNGWI
jgi:hypothetical protein